MIPLHSLLTMTPASSPADEKPVIDNFDGQQQAQQQQQSQHPTPPADAAQSANNGHTFNDPFNGNRPLTQDEQVAQYAQQNGMPYGASQQSPSNHHQSLYAFPNAYQQGQAGYFPSVQQRPASGSSNASSNTFPGNGNNRVPIPRQDSSVNSPAATGPMSSNVSLPPRPKPGRKPIQDDNSQDRRRKQNRDAQRSFRDRRTQKLSESMQQLTELNKERTDDQAKHRVEMNELKQRLAASEAENERLKAYIRQNFQNAGTHRRNTTADTNITGLALPPSNRRTGPSPRATPNAGRPTTASSPMETDFTNYGRVVGPFRAGTTSSSNDNAATTSNNTEAPTATVDGAAEDASSPGLMMGIEDKDYSCGFCTDLSNCLCRQHDAEGAEMLVALSESSPQSIRRRRENDYGPDAGDGSVSPAA